VSDQGDGIFREIDEEVRRDQLMALWKRYGRYFVGILVLLVLLAAGFQFWRSYRDSELERQSTSYEEAVEATADAPPEERAARFASLAQELDGGYVLLARLRQAGALIEMGDTRAAVALYRDVAEMAEDPRLSAYARYLTASAMLQSEGPDAAIALLAQLAQQDSPIYYSALELLGVAYLEAGDSEAARSQFAAIVEDPAAPPAIKSRAEEMLAILPPDIAPEEQQTAPASDERTSDETGSRQP